MEHLVRFRMLTNQLDNKEFVLFLSRLIQKHNGRALIMRCLFEHFLQSNDNQKELAISPITNIISNIITSRDPNKPIDNGLSLDSITKLPSALISETASYLKAPEYIIFSRCNRKIYVSCNSPCKIYHMPTCLLKRYPESASMQKFKSLKQLGLNIRYFNTKISMSNQATWQNVKLHTLQLSNRYSIFIFIFLFLFLCMRYKYKYMDTEEEMRMI